MGEINQKEIDQILKVFLPDAVRYNDVGMALQSIVKLEQASESGEGNGEEIFKALITARWVALPNLDDETCLDLLEKYLPVAFSIPEYSLEEKLAKKVLFLELEDIQIEFMERVLEVLEKNSMKFGNKNMTLEGKLVEPTLGNWLKDFLNTPAKSALRTNLDEVKFTTNSKNFGLLSESEKKILLELIKIYNSIKNRVVKYKSLPVTTNEAEAFKDFNLYKWLPGLDFEEDNKTIKTSSPIETREDLSGVGVSIAGKDSLSYLNSQKIKLPQEVKSTTSPVVPKVKPVNLAEIMKNKDKIDLGGGSGIRFGGQESNQSISQSANQKNLQGEQKPKAQVDIEKKLEDLKKRKGSKLT